MIDIETAPPNEPEAKLLVPCPSLTTIELPLVDILKRINATFPAAVVAMPCYTVVPFTYVKVVGILFPP